MPDITLTADNRVARTGQIDKLTLTYEESARIVLLENPTFVWVHQLRAPKIVEGRPVKIQKTRRARGGGSGGDEDKYETFDMDFIGRPRCLGDYGVIQDKGVDPANCPACQRSTEGDQVRAPERRFAVNVIRYGMDRNNKLITPFTCSCVVWAFGERDFDRLIALAEEYSEDGGLIGRDLRLGPCTSAAFQNFEITPGAQPVWKHTDEIKARVVDTFKENRVSKKELEAACGREVSAVWMRDDIDRVAARWRIVDTGAADPRDLSAPADRASLATGLDDLLTTAVPVAPAAAAPAGDDLAALLEGTAPTPAPVTADLSDLLAGGDTVPANGAPANGDGPGRNGSGDTAPAEVLDFDALLNL